MRLLDCRCRYDAGLRQGWTAAHLFPTINSCPELRDLRYSLRLLCAERPHDVPRLAALPPSSTSPFPPICTSVRDCLSATSRPCLRHSGHFLELHTDSIVTTDLEVRPILRQGASRMELRRFLDSTGPRQQLGCLPPPRCHVPRSFPSRRQHPRSVRDLDVRRQAKRFQLPM